MIDIILTGCNGKMGDAVTACIAEKSDIRIAAGIDINDSVSRSYPVYKSFDDIGGIKADAVIDFSNPAVFGPMIATKAFPFEPKLKRLDDNLFTLELFNGPTGSHRDFGVSYMAACLETILTLKSLSSIITER